ncbi:Uncharacterised protein [Bartonella grahamii]|uniref:Uncharacterized protein n=1 Tax=Bartonella grahamii TaxID=33045 RepID=A0A336NE13_BARGR|nr:Uncharacterised protein [Bartonella grahamii]
MSLKTFYNNYSNIFYDPIVYSFLCFFLFEYFIDKKLFEFSDEEKVSDNRLSY